MSKKHEEESYQKESYQINPKGALSLKYGMETAKEIMDLLELHARRLSKDGIPAIVFDEGASFQTLVKQLDKR